MSILVTRSQQPSYEEYCKEIKELWKVTGVTNMGVKHKATSGRTDKVLEVDKQILFTNGHMALELALRVLKVKGEVITTPFTFASTTQAIARCGIEHLYFVISMKQITQWNVDKIEDLITEKTEAIVPVHVYGNICDYKKIEEIAEKHHLKVIYDAAHAFGETIDGKKCCKSG